MERISRRQFAGSMLFALVFGSSGIVTAQSQRDYLNFETLCLRIYPKTPKEEIYLQDIIDKVEKKEIPLKIFIAAYEYAMKKSKGERIYYFEKCLSILCAQARLKIVFKPMR